MTGADPFALRLALELVALWRRLVPAERRDDWLREWSAEVRSRWLDQSQGGGRPTGLQRLRLVVRCLGAAFDATLLRWHAGGRALTVGSDLHHAWRGLAKRPRYTAFMVFVLALGIAASTTVWSAVRGVLLAPLPYPESERLVVLWDSSPALGIERSGPTPANLLDWRERNRSFSALAAYYAGEPRTLDSREGAEKVAVAEVTTGFFDALAKPPLLGRFFTPEEVAGGEAVTVLSHHLWRSRFGGEASVVDRDVEIDGHRYRVVGVMPPTFAVPDERTALWLPWDFQRVYASHGHVPRDYRFLRVVGRLEEGVAVAQAQEDMDRIARALAEEYPVNRGWSVRVIPFKRDLVGDLRAPLAALAGAVAFVLLIAALNAALLLLGRLAGRGGELAVRSALGASRLRLTRLVALETVLLSVAAAALGLALSYPLLGGLIELAPDGLPRLSEVALDGHSAAQAAATMVLVGALLAAVAAWACRSPERAAALGGWRSSAGGHRWPAGLVVTQVAAAFALVTVAMLTVASLRHLRAVDPGFATDRLLVARVFPDPEVYDTSPRRLAYFDELRARLGALPGVESVGAASGLPLNAYNNAPSVLYAAADAPVVDGGPEANVFMVTAGYLETMGMRLLDGRLLDGRDRPDSERVLVVNEPLARSVWPGERAVGKRLRLRFGRDRDFDFTVVGVVAGARSESLRVPPRAEAFRPHTQAPYVTMNVVLRTDAAAPLLLADAVRREVLAIDPTQPAHSVTTIGALVGTSIAPDRLSTWLLAALAALALTLAAVGVYGVMAHAVRARTREIGVRMALGATPGGVVARIVRRGAKLLAVGLLLGLGVALLAARLLSHLLFGVSATDAPTLVLAGTLLAAVVLAACWLPAARAAGIDPAAVLRSDI